MAVWIGTDGTPVAGNSQSTADFTYIFDEAATEGGFITIIECYIQDESGGVLNFAVFNDNGGGSNTDEHAELSLPISNGLNQFVDGVDFDSADLPIDIGQYIGFYITSSGLMDKETTGGPGYKYDSGSQISGTPAASTFTTSPNTAHDTQIRAFIEEASSSSSSSSLSSSSSSSSTSSSSSQSSSSSSCAPTVWEDITLKSVSSSSTSSSSSSTTPGTVVYGHDTGTEEDFIEDISGNWTGNNISISGSGDNETLTLHCPSACATNLTWYLGSGSAQIIIDKYQTGQGTLTSIEYKTGTTKVAAEAASWQIYNGTNFNSLGWVVVRLCRE
jgi:hypothetical protein